MVDKHWIENVFPPKYNLKDYITSSDAHWITREFSAGNHITMTEIYSNIADELVIVKKNKKDMMIDQQEDCNSTVWTADELVLVKKESEKIKTENKNLTAHLMLVSKENESLKQNNLELSSKLDQLTTHVAFKTKQNERLMIAVQHYEKKAANFEKRYSSLTRNIQQEKQKRADELTNLTKNYQLIKEHNQTFEAYMDHYFTQARNEKRADIDQITATYEEKLSKLQEEVSRLNTLLESQQQTYEVTKKALEQLRIHISNCN